jgi:glucuronate isomerase
MTILFDSQTNERKLYYAQAELDPIFRFGCSTTRDIERGELPNDEALIGGMVRRICFQNARDYLGLELGLEVSSSPTAVYAPTS